MQIIKNISNKIYIHKSCYIVILLAILSANFQMILIVSLLLFIHECGHFFTAMLLKWSTEKIVFYPFGGISKFSHFINCPLKEEILVLLMGPLMQMLGYYFILSLDFFINYSQSIKIINYSILLFNLLPIYPLDGGKLLHCFICFFTSYNMSFKIVYLISYLLLTLIIIFFIYSPNLNIFLILILLITRLKKEQKLTNYYKEKFLLERYLHKYRFKKSKIVTTENNFKRDYHHLLKLNKDYLLEEEYLKNKYKK